MKHFTHITDFCNLMSEPKTYCWIILMSIILWLGSYAITLIINSLTRKGKIEKDNRKAMGAIFLTTLWISSYFILYKAYDFAYETLPLLCIILFIAIGLIWITQTLILKSKNKKIKDLMYIDFLIIKKKTIYVKDNKSQEYADEFYKYFGSRLQIPSKHKVKESDKENEIKKRLLYLFEGKPRPEEPQLNFLGTAVELSRYGKYLVDTGVGSQQYAILKTYFLIDGKTEKLGSSRLSKYQYNLTYETLEDAIK